MRPAIGAVALSLTLAACVPDTDLFDERGPGGRADGGPGATAAELVEPVSGALDVPRNLAAVVVRFPAPVMAADDGADGGAPGGEVLRLRGMSGEVAAGGALAPSICPGAGSCYRLAMAGPLSGLATYRVELGVGLRTEAGDPVPPGVVGEFSTAADADDRPPRIDDVMIEAGAGACLRVRFTTDEPAEGRLLVRAGGMERVVAAGAGITLFDFAASLVGLPPNAEGAATVRAIDRSSNIAESPELPLRTPVATPPLAITEVLANAAGTEPAQEMVEIRNLGDLPLALGGMRIEDAAGGDVLPDAEVPPRGYAIIVTASYDAASEKDARPAAGTLIVRVDTRIGSDGLANAGEPVRLRSADGTVISSYGGWVDVAASTWSGKSTHRTAEDGCDHPMTWTKKPLAATPGGPAP